MDFAFCILYLPKTVSSSIHIYIYICMIHAQSIVTTTPKSAQYPFAFLKIDISIYCRLIKSILFLVKDRNY